MSDWLIFPALAYLAGTFPTGVLLGRLKGRDPRDSGSGNMGASNVTRTLGKWFGALTLLVDLVKGFVPTLLALSLSGPEIAATAAFAAVVGHCYPVWLKFKGGKGVATAFGVMAALSPIAALLSAMAWVLTVFITRVPTYGSMLAAGLFVVLVREDNAGLPLRLLTVGLLALLVWRHRSNLAAIKNNRRKRYPKRRTRRGHRR